MTNWQPIETAPKDGKFVLVYARDNRYHSDGDQTEWVASYERGAWMYADGEYSVCPAPTHWMPLPEPPSGLVEA